MSNNCGGEKKNLSRNDKSCAEQISVRSDDPPRARDPELANDRLISLEITFPRGTSTGIGERPQNRTAEISDGL